MPRDAGNTRSVLGTLVLLLILLAPMSNRANPGVRSYGGVQFPLRRPQRNRGAAGMTGESVRLPVSLTLADHIWAGQCVAMMNLDEVQQVLGIRFEGLLSQDILRESRSVRIDYTSHVIVLEQQRAPHHVNETMFRSSC